MVASRAMAARRKAKGGRARQSAAHEPDIRDQVLTWAKSRGGRKWVVWQWMVQGMPQSQAREAAALIKVVSGDNVMVPLDAASTEVELRRASQLLAAGYSDNPPHLKHWARVLQALIDSHGRGDAWGSGVAAQAATYLRRHKSVAEPLTTDFSQERNAIVRLLARLVAQPVADLALNELADLFLLVVRDEEALGVELSEKHADDRAIVVAALRWAREREKGVEPAVNRALRKLGLPASKCKNLFKELSGLRTSPG